MKRAAVRVVSAMCVWWLVGAAPALAASVLTPVAGSPFTTGSGPSSVAFSPTGGLLATANGGVDFPGNTVSVFAINASTGALTQVPGSPFPTGSGPTSVAFSPTGGLLATTNAGAPESVDNTVSVFAVNALTGALTQVAGSPFTTGSQPLSVAFSPIGGLLATANQSDSTVSVFAVNALTGVLTQVAGSPFPTGRYPRSVAFSPTGGLLATADSDGVSVFAVNSSTGGLTQVAGSPFTTGVGPNSVAFSPTGALLATANYVTDDTASVFAVNSSTGALTQVAGSPFLTDIGPTSAAFSPTGGLLATANYITGDYADKKNGTVSLFAVNASTGAPTQVPGSPFTTGSYPYSVAFSPTGGLLATANIYDNTVSVFALGPSVPTSTGSGSGRTPPPRISAVQAHSAGTVRLRVQFRGTGNIDVMETAWNDNLASIAVLQPALHRFVFARAHAHVTGAGSVDLLVTPNARGIQLVHDHRYRVTLRLWVTFTPEHGGPRSSAIYGLHLATQR